MNETLAELIVVRGDVAATNLAALEQGLMRKYSL
jgi:hypothetical protein